jgi:putative serine/threonine protein kinase
LRESPVLSRGPVEKSALGCVLCYPRAEPFELQRRITELASLGVDTIELTGSQFIGRAKVLGKGCVGIVVIARIRRKAVAVKIRRTDADRRDMGHEAKMLRLANSVRVGPKLIAESENFLVMELVKGIPLHRWVEQLPTARSKTRARRLVGKVLEDCFRLDRAHLDHGELSEAARNVLVENDRPRIVDFESASDTRRTSNVTSIAQYLLIGGGAAKRLRAILRWRKRARLIRALRDYKQNPDLQRFRRIKLVVGV